MIDILPTILWAAALIPAIVVCMVSIRRSRMDIGSRRTVDPVSWTVVGLHVGSLVLAMVPYVVVLVVGRGGLSPAAWMFYSRVGWWSAVIMIAVVAAGLGLMYRQARRSMRSSVVGVSSVQLNDEYQHDTHQEKMTSGKDDKAHADDRPEADDGEQSQNG